MTATFQDGESTWFSYVSALTNDGSQPNNHHKPNFAIGNGELLDDRADNANGQAIGAGAHKAQNAGGLLSAVYWEDEDLDGIFEEHRSHDKGDGSIARAGLEQQLIVGRIDWGESFDTVSMFAFDISMDDGYLPPTMGDFEDNAVSIETLDNLDQASFDMISVHGSRTHFDEIRIGTEFGDVVLGGVEEELCDPSTGGDLDGNGAVDFADFLVLSANFGFGIDGPSAHESGDIDCNGTVEFADFLILSSNFGAPSATQSVPEPSVLSLFGISVFCMLCGPFRRARRI